MAGAPAAGAFAIGPKTTRAARRPRTPRLRTVFVAGFAAATLHAAAPETWAGLALAAVVIAIGGPLLLRASRGADWGLGHAAALAALAAGAVLSVGVLAFTYYPVIGEVSAVRKYSHNVAMLLVVAAASAYTVHRARDPGAEVCHGPRFGLWLDGQVLLDSPQGDREEDTGRIHDDV